MDAPKAAASLSGGLLARKGLARPAMRRQTVVGLSHRSGPLEDLGWNDMGEDALQSAPAPSPLPTVEPASPSPVAVHIAAIQETLNRRADERADSVAKVKANKVKAEAPKPARPAQQKRSKPVAPAPDRANRKSAFTLRIDEERHLRLRLLSAVENQSAQTLLIGALDALLDQYPDIDALARDPKARRNVSLSGME